MNPLHPSLEARFPIDLNRPCGNPVALEARAFDRDEAIANYFRHYPTGAAFEIYWMGRNELSAASVSRWTCFEEWMQLLHT